MFYRHAVTLYKQGFHFSRCFYPDRSCHLGMVVGPTYCGDPTELYWIEHMFLHVLTCQTGRLRNSETKSNNLRCEGEIILPTVEGYDGSKVYPFANEELQRCYQRKEGLRKDQP